jgi:hypothetical protein
MVIDGTILERSGRHIEDAFLVFDHAQGRSVW